MSKAPDFLSMSDDDFLKEPPASGEPPASSEETGEKKPEEGAEEVGATTEEPKPEETEGKKPEGTEGKTQTTEQTASETSTTETEPKPDVTGKKPAKTPDAQLQKGKDKVAEGAQTEQTEGKEKAEAKPETSATDYEAFYKQIMTPFKANGRTIELKSPDEAIALMQMGANYTKKMQELVPHRKVLTMLQNNGLMDEGQLSFLIDLKDKNPEAIKKLIKDAGIDPLEIDTSTEPAYQEGNHRVSDEEVAFHSTLDDMKSTPERVETLKVINDGWDQASKEALWKNPEIMTIIHGQRENGIYDRITQEVNRQRTLGQIPTNVPFLQAYKVIGDQMTAANAFDDLNLKGSKTAAPSTTKVVDTRVETPKPAVKNGDKAAAASTNRTTPAKGKGPTVNPLAMSDDDFLKQMNGRL